jgi:hypothetical protein
VRGRDFRTDESVDLTYLNEPLLYLRLVPSKPTALLSGSQVSDLVRDPMLSPLRTGVGGWSTDRNPYGGIVYRNDDTGTKLLASTQLFPNVRYNDHDLLRSRMLIHAARSSTATGGRHDARIGNTARSQDRPRRPASSFGDRMPVVRVQTARCCQPPSGRRGRTCKAMIRPQSLACSFSSPFLFGLHVTMTTGDPWYAVRLQPSG